MTKLFRHENKPMNYDTYIHNYNKYTKLILLENLRFW